MLKNLRLLFLSLLLSASAYSQSWIYSGVINGSFIEPKYSCIDNQNNLLVLGIFNGTINAPFNMTSYGGNDVVLLKFNSSGNLLWYKHIGSPSTEVCGGITIDNLNNIYVSGVFQGTCLFDGTNQITNTGLGDVFLAKYSNNGTLQWANRVCGANNNQGVNDIKFNSRDGLVMTGFFRDSLIIGNAPENYDTLTTNYAASSFIAIFDLNGAIQKVKNFNQTFNLSRINKIALNSDGYIFCGNYQQSFYLDVATLVSMTSNQNDAFIYKTDLNLDGEWVRCIRGNISDNFKSIITDEYENVYVLGNYTSPLIYIDSTANSVITTIGTTSSTDVDTYLAKYNRSGILQWYIKRGGTGVTVSIPSLNPLHEIICSSVITA